MVEPVRLGPASLGVQVGRTHARVFDRLVDSAADAVDEVAAAAVVVVDEVAGLFGDRLGRGERLGSFLRELVAHQAQHVSHDVPPVAVGETELRHAELLGRALHLAPVVAAGVGELLLQPPLTGVRDVDVAEVQARDHLRSPGREVHADLLGVLEAADLVAAEAAVPANQPLTRKEQLLLLRHPGEALGSHRIREAGPQELAGQFVELAGVRLRNRHRGELRRFEPHEPGGDVGSLLVGEPEVRHVGLFPVVPGVPYPLINEAGVELGAGSDQRRTAPAVDARLVVAGLVGEVAPETADLVRQRLAARRIPPRGRRVVGVVRRMLEDVLHDRRDLGVVASPEFGIRVVLEIPEGRHPGGLPERLRIPYPARHEVAISLVGDPLERRSPVPLVLVTDRVVTPPAAGELIGHPALVELLRAGNEDLVAVTLDAARFREVRLVHRVVPVVVLLPAVLLHPRVFFLDRLGRVGRPAETQLASASEVAGGATEVVHRVAGLATHEDVQVRVRGEGLGRVRVVGVVDPEVTGLAAVDARHLGEVEFFGDVADQNLVDFDGGIDEVHDGQVAERVREAGGEAVELVAGERHRLGQLFHCAGALRHAGSLFAEFGPLPGQVEVEGHPDVPGFEEARFERLEVVVAHRPAERRPALAGLLVVELVGVVDRLDLALADVRQRAAPVKVGDFRLQGGEGGLLLGERRLGLREFRLDALQVRLVDPLLRFLDLPRRQVALHLDELPLEPLPLARVVEPDHPQRRQEQEDARNREDDVQLRDVVSVTGSDFGHCCLPRC